LLDTRGNGLPLTPIRHISAFERVQKPMPVKKLSAILFFLTHTNPIVLYLKPHASMTCSAFGIMVEIVHMNSTAFVSAMSLTGKEVISSCDISPYLRPTQRLSECS